MTPIINQNKAEFGISALMCSFYEEGGDPLRKPIRINLNYSEVIALGNAVSRPC